MTHGVGAADCVMGDVVADRFGVEADGWSVEADRYSVEADGWNVEADRYGVEAD